MDEFLKLMTEFWTLKKSGFKGQVVVNFDGDGPKDIKCTSHQAIQEITIDQESVRDLREVARKIIEGTE